MRKKKRRFDPSGQNAVMKKKGELLTSHRYDHIPLLDSSPGGFCGSWSYKTHPGTKVGIFYIFAKIFDQMRKKTLLYIFFAGLSVLLIA